MEGGSIKIYQVDYQKVMKVNVDRFFIKGSRFDRDIHGAQIVNLIFRAYDLMKVLEIKRCKLEKLYEIR